MFSVAFCFNSRRLTREVLDQRDVVALEQDLACKEVISCGSFAVGGQRCLTKRSPRLLVVGLGNLADLDGVVNDEVHELIKTLRTC